MGFAADAAVAVQGAVDAFPTPFFKWSRRMMYGVEIHANTAATIWAGHSLVSYSPLWLAALFALLSLSPWLARGEPLLLFSATSGLLLALAGLSVLFFRWQLLHIDVVPALAATMGSSLWWGVTGFIATVREKLEMRRAFDRYVPPEVVGEIIRNPAMLALGGQRRELSVLFSDIRGFTSISEKITPEQLVALLNSYLNRMTNVVFANHGTLDKYIGDAIMAIFGAPLPRNDHAVWACRTALVMLQRLEEVVPEWRAAGLDRPRIGIGVNSGEMIVGNIGSEQRLDYTVIGDAVNLASRLEGLNKTYGTAVIISEDTWRAVGQHFLCRELDFVRVKGKDRPVRIFELLAEAASGGGYGPRLQIFARGLAAYRDRLWDQAALAFRQVLADYPADGPARLFLQRCTQMQEEPPGEQWDGVWIMLDK